MPIACICGKGPGFEPEGHQNDCPVKRQWEREGRSGSFRVTIPEGTETSPGGGGGVGPYGIRRTFIKGPGIPEAGDGDATAPSDDLTVRFSQDGAGLRALLENAASVARHGGRYDIEATCRELVKTLGPRRAVVWVGLAEGAFRGARHAFGIYWPGEEKQALADGMVSLARVEIEEGRFDE